MVFKKYNYPNNAKNVPVKVAFTDTDTQMILEDGWGDLLESSNMIGTVDGYSGGVLVKSEVIYITSRSVDTLTGITRGYENSVQDPQADPQTQANNALDFTGLDTYLSIRQTKEGINDIQNEITNITGSLLPLKLDIADFLSGDPIKASSSNGTDDYTVTMSEVTAYADIANRPIYIKVDVANTADATLNINGLGAKDIEKFMGEALSTGDIKAGSTIELIYDATADAFEITSVFDQSSSATVLKFQGSAVLGEDATAGDKKGSFFWGRGLLETLNQDQLTGGTNINTGDGTQLWIREQITVPADGLNAAYLLQKKYNLQKVGSPVDNLTFKVYESDGTTLIASLLDIGGGNLTTSYKETSVLDEAVTTPINDNFGFGSSFGNDSANGIRITMTKDAVLTSIGTKFGLPSVSTHSTTVTIYNETDAVTVYSGSVNINDALSVPNILLEDTKTYRITATDSGTTTGQRSTPSFPTSYANFDLIGGYNGISGNDATYIYNILNLVTQEVVAGSVTNVDLSSYVGQNVYIEIKRSGGQDAANYYQIEGKVGTSVEYWNGAAWVADTTDLYSVQRWGFNYIKDQAWLTDTRYSNTYLSDGVLIQSGSALDTVNYITSGDLEQTEAKLNSAYYLLNGSKTGYSMKDADKISSFDVSGQDAQHLDIYMSNDGGRMYTIGNTSDSVYQYSLAIPFDITSAVYIQSFSVNAQDATPEGLWFKPDGTKFYIIGISNDRVYEYDLTTPWDLSTASYSTNFVSVSAQDGSGSGVAFNTDGSKMFISGFANDKVYEYDLGTNWDVSTAVFSQDFSVVTEDTVPHGLQFNNDGTKLFIVGATNGKIFEYDLTTGFDLSTASYSGKSHDVSGEYTTPVGIAFANDGVYAYVIGSVNAVVTQYFSGDADNGKGEFGEYPSFDFSEFVLGVGNKDTNIELMINEQNYANSLPITDAVIIAGGDNTYQEANTLRSSTNTAFELKKTFKIGDLYNSRGQKIPFPLNLRITFQHTHSTGGAAAEVDVRINGVSVYTVSTTATSAVTRNFDTAQLNKGDVIDMYLRRTAATGTAYIENAKIQYSTDFTGNNEGEVLLD